MSMSSERRSATIYDFTARLRAAGRTHRPESQREPRAQALPAAEFGSGWYHDAAIQEADRTRKP